MMSEYEESISANVGKSAAALSIHEVNELISVAFENAASAETINWTKWTAANKTLAVLRYYALLTGGNDGLEDLDLPISSFSARLSKDLSCFLQVVVPNYSLCEEIEKRSNGDLVLTIGYAIPGVDEMTAEFLRVDLEIIRKDVGALSSSLTLFGHRTLSFASKTIVLPAATYFAEYSGLRRLRVPETDIWMRPGDTVIYGSEIFVVGKIFMMASVRFNQTEIIESAE